MREFRVMELGVSGYLFLDRIHKIYRIEIVWEIS